MQMNPSAHYSIAFCPPSDIVQSVKDCKELLKKHIGWYKSKNAEAYISINEFEANEQTLRVWVNFLQRFSAEQNNFDVLLNGVGTYIGGVFYLAPNKKSREQLNGMMKDFHKKAPIKAATKKTNEAHMTIGSGLTDEQLDLAFRIFNPLEINLAFNCNHICLRKFDPLAKQYHIEQRFIFGGKTASEPIQAGLW